MSAPAAVGLPPTIRSLYPFETRRRETGRGGVSYLDEGEGLPVVCVHGNPTWSFFFRRFVLERTPGLRWIVPDHLGCGLSDPSPGHLRFTDHAANLRGLLDDLGIDRFSLVVHDWGGAIGLEVASRMPERVGKIVILNTAAFPSPWMPFRIRLCRLPVVGRWAMIRLNLFARAAVRMAVTRELPPAVAEGYLFPWNERRKRVTVADFVADIPMTRRHPSWRDLDGLGQRLGVLADHPMRIVWGMRDFCFSPRFLGEWKRRFPAADVRELPDAGHYLVEDEPEAVVPLVNGFLAPTEEGG